LPAQFTRGDLLDREKDLQAAQIGLVDTHEPGQLAVEVVLAEKLKGLDLDGSSTADLADHTFIALTDSMTLLKTKAPAEAENFRATITTITDAASRAHKGGPGPAETAMIRKITAALDNA
jgi:hypothetical protein